MNKKNKSKKNKSKKNKSKKNIKKGGFLFSKQEEKPNLHENRDTFRDSFMKIFEKIYTKIPLYQITNQFIDLFKKNQQDINTLIPVNHARQPVNKYKQNDTPIIDFVSIPVVMIYNVTDYKQLKNLINAFIENKGDINLSASKSKITAYGAAKQMKNSVLQTFIDGKFENKNKNKERSNDHVQIQQQQQRQKQKKILLRATIESTNNLEIPEIPEIPEIEENQEIEEIEEQIKLDFTQPNFSWAPLFSLEEFKQKIQTIAKQHSNANGMYTMNACAIIKTIIPTHSVQEKLAIYNPGRKGQTLNYDQPIIQESPDDLIIYYTNVCATMLICAFLSIKLESQNCKIVFKGGKAIQLVVDEPYETDDVDIQIVYDNEDESRALAGHIGEFIKWCLPDNKIIGSFINDIYKLSYAKSADDLRAFCDISYKQADPRFFSNLEPRPFHIEELDSDILFNIQSVDDMIREKIFLYTKYFLCNNEINCEYHANKFKRSLLALLKSENITRGEIVRYVTNERVLDSLF